MSFRPEALLALEADRGFVRAGLDAFHTAVAARRGIIGRLSQHFPDTVFCQIRSDQHRDLGIAVLNASKLSLLSPGMH
ncbi:MAG TPA: hypothetical protein VNB78_04250 [Sphingomicrobium sp.]|nr:hypothetical protein [Sphingomicrobium sp.]